MPIYEYRCAACDRKASLFFRSITSVEPNPVCPHCGEMALQRRMSRVWAHRSTADNDLPQPTFEDEGVPFYGPNPYEDPYTEGADMWGAGDEDSDIDAAEMAREARSMARMMGEPLDAEFDEALRHVERGADPDDVFGELDSRESEQELPPVDSDP